MHFVVLTVLPAKSDNDLMFHSILTCGPVKTSFQVDIEIYED